MYVDGVVELLVNYNKEVKCPKVDKEIYKWLVSQRKWANEADDAAMNFFLNRAAAIGDRAGKLAYVLEGAFLGLKACGVLASQPGLKPGPKH